MNVWKFWTFEDNYNDEILDFADSIDVLVSSEHVASASSGQLPAHDGQRSCKTIQIFTTTVPIQSNGLRVRCLANGVLICGASEGFQEFQL